jgi:hypothetical protein
MALGTSYLGGAPLAGEPLSPQTTPGVHPTPGGDGAFLWTILPYWAPLAGGVLAGGALYPTYPGGGVTLEPDPEHGVMRVRVWWPNAAALQILRVDAAGVRTPVRGGYPLVVQGSTRTNRSTNPTITSGLTGYTAGTGAPTLAAVARTDEVGGQAVRATVAAAGTDELVVPGVLGRTTAVTIGVDLCLSALPSGVTITVAWVNAAGTALASTTATLTTDQVTASVDQYYRQVVRLVPPANANASSSIRIAATGMPAGGWLAVDRVTLDEQDTDGSYIDGNSVGARWTGTPELSTSVLAPQQVLVDGECPLDVPVQYLIASPGLAGGAMLSAVGVLDSLGRTWLTHPSWPDAPRVVQVQGSAPVLTYGLEQGVFRVLDRARPIVRSAAVRQSATGTINLGGLSIEEKYTLEAMFADLSPLLLRTPADYDPDDLWMSLGELTKDPEGRKPWQETRVYRAPFVEVEAPDPALT